MATKRKVKSGTKRRKAPARKPAARRKAVKARKKPAAVKARAVAAAKPRPTPRRAPARPKPAAPRPQPAPPGERVGVVTHYFNHLGVAVIKLDAGTLRVGDTIHIRGHTTDFSQRVESLQVEHAAVTEVGPNDDFGIKVREHVREHDVVYKVT